MSTKAAITIQQLSKSYQESVLRHEIFKDLNLQVGSGEFIVLLGRSGSGKSTFFKSGQRHRSAGQRRNCH